MSSDIVRLPGGKVVTRSRAMALGLLDKDGNVKDTVPVDSQAAKVLRQDARAAEWAKSQGLPAPTPRAAKADGPRTTTDGILIKEKRIEPLRPTNVDSTGTAVTDEATLAAIAAETAAIDAAKVAEVGPTPAQKRLATMAANKAAREAAEAEAALIRYEEVAVEGLTDAQKAAKTIGEFLAADGVLPGEFTDDVDPDMAIQFVEGSEGTMRFLSLDDKPAEPEASA